jgi:molybdopterin-containing oxidoreductase family iron-sulfur binding subunit
MIQGSASEGAPSERQQTLQEQRREFLTKALAAAGGAAAVLGGPSVVASVIAREQSPDLLADNQAERMLADLRHAMRKPVEQRRWSMAIDLDKCIGCRACTVSCAAENNLPPGVVYRPVIEEEIGTYPNVRIRSTPRPCMHCDEPPCVPVCPADATHKRPDGIVDIHYDKCIGCARCIEACPYEARCADDGDFFGEETPEVTGYERRPNFEYGERWKRTPGDYDTPPIGKARKCHYCLHRIENGMLPACVTTCLGGAMYFGDANDKSSLVHEVIRSRRATRLHAEYGTKPTTVYLMTEVPIQ